jgi:hypothetical protein
LVATYFFARPAPSASSGDFPHKSSKKRLALSRSDFSILRPLVAADGLKGRLSNEVSRGAAARSAHELPSEV